MRHSAEKVPWLISDSKAKEIILHCFDLGFPNTVGRDRAVLHVLVVAINHNDSALRAKLSIST
jgi:hypothetical protein